MPVCDKYNIDMAIHPDDPAWPVFGLPRIITSQEGVCRMLKAVDNPHNGLTFCTGSYGTNRKNDLCEFIKAAQGRIHFAHVRNLKFNTAGKGDGDTPLELPAKDVGYEHYAAGLYLILLN